MEFGRVLLRSIISTVTNSECYVGCEKHRTCGGIRNVYVCSSCVLCPGKRYAAIHTHTEKEGFILDQTKQRSKHTTKWAVCGVCSQLSVRRCFQFLCWKTHSPTSLRVPVVSRKMASAREVDWTGPVFSRPGKRWHEASRVASDHTPNLCVLWRLRLASPQQALAAEGGPTPQPQGTDRGPLCGAESCRVHISWTGALRGGAPSSRASLQRSPLPPSVTAR